MLIKGKSRQAVGENIRREVAAGKKPKQAVAIALNTARKAGASIPPPPTVKPKLKRKPKKSLADMMDGNGA